MTITATRLNTPPIIASKPETPGEVDHPGMQDMISGSQDNPEALPDPDFIDVSRHNGDIDWGRYAAAGKKLAVCKLTEGGNWLDPKAAANREGMSKAGLTAGLYHFAGASGGGYINPAETEADNFLAKAGEMGPKEFPVLDFEQTYGMTGPQMTDWISKWCTRVEAQTGKTPWLYTNGKIRRQLDGTNLTKYPLWIADYRSSDKEKPPACEPWPSLRAWQYSEKASSPGVAGTCDGNFLYGPNP